MQRNIVLIDSGLLKYTTKYAVAGRLGVPQGDEGICELVKKPALYRTMFDIFTSTLKTRLNSIQKVFGRIDECIICVDKGVSWRMNIPKTIIPGTENIESSGEYKGHRHLSDPAIIQANFEYNREYEKVLENVCKISNIETVAEKNIEADDFMVNLGVYLSRENNVIILTDDYDITQAVRVKDNGFCFVLQWKHGKPNLVVPHRALEEAKFDDIFKAPRWQLQICQAIQNAEIIAPQYLILEKIVNGDSSDDITPVMVREKNGRRYKCNRKGFDAIHQYFAEHNVEGYVTMTNLYVEEDIEAILEIVHQNLFKTSYHDLPQDWQDFYKQKFRENRAMVAINEEELGTERYHLCVDKYQTCGHLQPIIDLPTYDILQRMQL